MVALMLVLTLFEPIRSLSIISHFVRLLSPKCICINKALNRCLNRNIKIKNAYTQKKIKDKISTTFQSNKTAT